MRNSIIKICMLLMTLYSLNLAAQTPPDLLNTLFSLGDKIQGGNFTGTVWVTQLLRLTPR